MIKNNKGFMLIEVVITATVVITGMITLYTSFSRLYNNYNTKNSYYNIDAVYATKIMANSMIKTDINFGNINKFINNSFTDDAYRYIIQSANCNVVTDPVTNETTYNVPLYTCEGIKELYKINNMIISKYDKESLIKLKTETLNQTFYDYIDYIITYYNIKMNEKYDYIILTETQDGNDYYYANLRMR